MASKYSTYNLPYLTEEPLKTLKALQKVSSPFVNILVAICVGQALLASTVTYFEGKAVRKIQNKLLQAENVEDLPQ